MSACHLTVTYLSGSLIGLEASFTRPPTQDEIDDSTADDADDWQPVDPDTVSFLTKDPNGDVEQYDYLGSPPGDVVRDDVGEYHLNISPTIAGTWTYRVESTGNGQAANEQTFVIQASAFP